MTNNVELFDSAPFVEQEPQQVVPQQNRQYQQQAIVDLRSVVTKGKRAPIYVCPTGGGKTIVAKDLIMAAVAKGGRVLFLAPRRELIYQSADKLARAKIPHGVIMAGEVGDYGAAAVQVASVPTLYARAVKRQRMPFPDASIVVVDEAHLARGEMTMAVLKQYPKAIRVGLTATPCRKDGKGLGEIFDELVLGPSVKWLIEHGYLVQPRYYVPSRPDLKGVKIQAGDYNSAQLGKVMDSKTIVGDVLTNWLRLAKDRKTVIFTVNVAHSLHIESVFRQAGIKIAHLDAQTPLPQRKQILSDLRAGRIQVVTNCDVLTLGWDEPSVSCVVLARPTKSLVRYMQSVGRALRTHPGKQDCLVIDNGGCVDEHGPVEDEHEWSLSLDSTVTDRDTKRKREKREPKDLTCGSCAYVFRSTPSCPKCGWNVPHGTSHNVHTVDDDLAEYKDRKRFKKEWTPAQKQVFYSELLGVVKAKGYNPGYAAWKYKEKFGVFPRSLDPIARPPSSETLAWLKHRQIAFAHRRQA